MGLTLFPFHDYSKGYQWGMSIDLSACIGCDACLVACQSENNIAVVGKDQGAARSAKCTESSATTGLGRGSAGGYAARWRASSRDAPCESAARWAATSHRAEGLNDMAYNSCVGTRYCLNNCPYKVRRFWFLAWNKNVRKSASWKSPRM